MNERRLAYQGAVKLAEGEKMDYIANVVLKQQLAEHEQDRKEISLRRRRAQSMAERRAKLASLQPVQAETLASQAQSEQLVTLGAQIELADTQADATEELNETRADAPAELDEAKSAQENEKAPSAPEPRPSAKPATAEATEAVTAGLFGTSGRRRRK